MFEQSELLPAGGWVVALCHLRCECCGETEGLRHERVRTEAKLPTDKPPQKKMAADGGEMETSTTLSLVYRQWMTEQSGSVQVRLAEHLAGVV